MAVSLSLFCPTCTPCQEQGVKDLLIEIFRPTFLMSDEDNHLRFMASTPLSQNGPLQ